MPALFETFETELKSSWNCLKTGSNFYAYYENKMTQNNL